MHHTASRKEAIMVEFWLPLGGSGLSGQYSSGQVVQPMGFAHRWTTPDESSCVQVKFDTKRLRIDSWW